jgi:hypothetical protein
MGGAVVSVPYVPDRDTGVESEIWYLNEALTNSDVKKLGKELLLKDTLVNKLIIRKCKLEPQWVLRSGLARSAKRSETLSFALENAETLNSLNISDTAIGPGDGIIIESLKHNPAITELIFSRNRVQDKTLIPQLFQIGCQLLHLDISHNNLTVRELSRICTTLRTDPVLVSLGLHGNSIGVEGLGMLGDALCRGNRRLRTLNLSRTQACGLDRLNQGKYDLQGLDKLLRSIERHGGISALDISSNHLKDEGAVLISKFLRKGDAYDTTTKCYVSTGEYPLLHLDVSDNHLCHLHRANCPLTANHVFMADGMLSLALSVKDHLSLTSLNIARNALRAELSATIVDIVNGNNSLTMLDTSFNEMCGCPASYTHDVLDGFIKAMGTNNTITDLNLAGNFLMAKGISKVAEWAKHGGIGVAGYYLTGEVKVLTRSPPFCLPVSLNLGNNCVCYGKEIFGSTSHELQIRQPRFESDNSALGDFAKAVNTGDLLEKVDLQNNGDEAAEYYAKLLDGGEIDGVELTHTGRMILSPVEPEPELEPEEEPDERDLVAAKQNDFLTRHHGGGEVAIAQ